MKNHSEPALTQATSPSDRPTTWAGGKSGPARGGPGIRFLPRTLAALLLPLAVLAEPSPRQEAKPAHKFYGLNLKKTEDPVRYRYAFMKIGENDACLLIDTGCATSIMLEKSAAEGFGLSLRKIGTVMTVAGRADCFAGRADINLPGGHIRYHQYRLDAMPLPQGFPPLCEAGRRRPADGLIGAGLLCDLRAVLSLRNSRLLIPSPETPKGFYRRAHESAGDPATPLFRGSKNEAYAPLRIRGKDYLFLIDTGAASNTIKPAVAASLNLPRLKSRTSVTGAAPGIMTGVESTVTERVILANRIQIPVSFLVIETPSATRTAPLEIAGTLGLPVFDTLGASLDFDSYSLFIPAPSKPPPPLPAHDATK